MLALSSLGTQFSSADGDVGSTLSLSTCPLGTLAVVWTSKALILVRTPSLSVQCVLPLEAPSSVFSGVFWRPSLVSPDADSDTTTQQYKQQQQQQQHQQQQQQQQQQGVQGGMDGDSLGGSAHFALACSQHLLFVEVVVGGGGSVGGVPLDLAGWCAAAEESGRQASPTLPPLPPLSLKVLGTLTAEPAALFTCACAGLPQALLIGREDGRLLAVTWDSAEVAYDTDVAAIVAAQGVTSSLALLDSSSSPTATAATATVPPPSVPPASTNRTPRLHATSLASSIVPPRPRSTGAGTAAAAAATATAGVTSRVGASALVSLSDGSAFSFHVTASPRVRIVPSTVCLMVESEEEGGEYSTPGEEDRATSSVFYAGRNRALAAFGYASGLVSVFLGVAAFQEGGGGGGSGGALSSRTPLSLPTTDLSTPPTPTLSTLGAAAPAAAAAAGEEEDIWAWEWDCISTYDASLTPGVAPRSPPTSSTAPSSSEFKRQQQQGGHSSTACVGAVDFWGWRGALERPYPWAPNMLYVTSAVTFSKPRGMGRSKTLGRVAVHAVPCHFSSGSGGGGGGVGGGEEGGSSTSASATTSEIATLGAKTVDGSGSSSGSKEGTSNTAAGSGGGGGGGRGSIPPRLLLSTRQVLIASTATGTGGSHTSKTLPRGASLGWCAHDRVLLHAPAGARAPNTGAGGGGGGGGAYLWKTEIALSGALVAEGGRGAGSMATATAAASFTVGGRAGVASAATPSSSRGYNAPIPSNSLGRPAAPVSSGSGRAPLFSSTYPSLPGSSSALIHCISGDGSGASSVFALTLDSVVMAAAAAVAGGGGGGTGATASTSLVAHSKSGGSAQQNQQQQQQQQSQDHSAPWRLIPPSSHYTPIRAPLTLLSVSPDATRAAVAGSAGCAVYTSRGGGGWHVFQRPAEEGSFKALALAWVGNRALLVLSKPTSSSSPFAAAAAAATGGVAGSTPPLPGDVYDLHAFPKAHLSLQHRLGHTRVSLPRGAVISGMFTTTVTVSPAPPPTSTSSAGNTGGAAGAGAGAAGGGASSPPPSPAVIPWVIIAYSLPTQTAPTAAASPPASSLPPFRLETYFYLLTLSFGEEPNVFVAGGGPSGSASANASASGVTGSIPTTTLGSLQGIGAYESLTLLQLSTCAPTEVLSTGRLRYVTGITASSQSAGGAGGAAGVEGGSLLRIVTATAACKPLQGCAFREVGTHRVGLPSRVRVGEGGESPDTGSGGSGSGSGSGVGVGGWEEVGVPTELYALDSFTLQERWGGGGGIPASSTTAAVSSSLPATGGSGSSISSSSSSPSFSPWLLFAPQVVIKTSEGGGFVCDCGRSGARAAASGAAGPSYASSTSSLYRLPIPPHLRTVFVSTIPAASYGFSNPSTLLLLTLSNGDSAMYVPNPPNAPRVVMGSGSGSGSGGGGGSNSPPGAFFRIPHKLTAVERGLPWGGGNGNGSGGGGGGVSGGGRRRGRGGGITPSSSYNNNNNQSAPPSSTAAAAAAAAVSLAEGDASDEEEASEEEEEEEEEEEVGAAVEWGGTRNLLGPLPGITNAGSVLGVSVSHSVLYGNPSSGGGGGDGSNDEGGDSASSRDTTTTYCTLPTLHLPLLVLAHGASSGGGGGGSGGGGSSSGLSTEERTQLLACGADAVSGVLMAAGGGGEEDGGGLADTSHFSGGGGGGGGGGSVMGRRSSSAVATKVFFSSSSSSASSASASASTSIHSIPGSFPGQLMMRKGGAGHSNAGGGGSAAAAASAGFTSTPGVVSSALRAFLYGALETSEESPLHLLPAPPSPHSSWGEGVGGVGGLPLSSMAAPSSSTGTTPSSTPSVSFFGTPSKVAKAITGPPLHLLHPASSSSSSHMQQPQLTLLWSPLSPRGVRRLPPLTLNGVDYHVDTLLDAPAGRVLRALAGALRAHARVEGWVVPRDLQAWCARHPWGVAGIDSTVWGGGGGGGATLAAAAAAAAAQGPLLPTSTPTASSHSASGGGGGGGGVSHGHSLPGGTPGPLLGGVLSLLGRVGDDLYAETVAAVGRTAEEDRLRALFPIAGHPVDLFRGCLARAGRASVAAAAAPGGAAAAAGSGKLLHTHRSVRALRTAAALLLLVQEHIMREEEEALSAASRHKTLGVASGRGGVAGNTSSSSSSSSQASAEDGGNKNSPRVLRDTLMHAGELLSAIGVPKEAVKVLTGPGGGSSNSSTSSTSSGDEVEGALSVALGAAVASAPPTSPHLALLLASIVTSTATYCSRLQLSSPPQPPPSPTLSSSASAAASSAGAPSSPRSRGDSTLSSGGTTAAVPIGVVGGGGEEDLLASVGGGFWGTLIGLLVGDTTSTEEGEVVPPAGDNPPQSLAASAKNVGGSSGGGGPRSWLSSGGGGGTTTTTTTSAASNFMANPILLALSSPSASIPLPIPAPPSKTPSTTTTSAGGGAAALAAVGASSGNKGGVNSGTGEVAAVGRLVREVVELQTSFLGRTKRDPQQCLRVPCIILLAHLLHRG